MLNYFAMKDLILRRYALIIMLAVFLTACSGSGGNGNSTSTSNAPAESNSNSNPQEAVAQNGAPIGTLNPTPPSVVQIPTPAHPDKAAPPQNTNSASAPQNANSAIVPPKIASSESAPQVATPAPNGKAPKLELPQAKIDFGKQEQGKTLNRAIAIKNTGKADLNIESVVPS